jgi:4-hydroxy-tetrahydrodipicolinate synthase
MFDKSRLRGIITPMVTPLLADETLDVAGTRRLVRYLLGAGVHGLFVLGSTGEFPRLTDKTREHAIEVVVEEANGRVVVLAGVSDTGTARVIEHAKRAQQAGADAAVSTLPFPFKLTTPHTQIDYYRTLTEAVEMPWMIYNVPPLIGVGIAAATFGQLALLLPNLVGAKDSETVMHLQDTVEFTRATGFRVFQGNEYNLNTSILMGAAGGTPSPSNLFPALYVELYNLSVAGRHTEAAALQSRLNRLVDGLDAACGDVPSLKWPGVVKEGLAMLGICGVETARPTVPCTDDDRNVVADVLRRAGVL